MIINKRPVLHVVEKATHFGAAMFLNEVSSNNVWNSVMKCWFVIK